MKAIELNELVVTTNAESRPGSGGVILDAGDVSITHPLGATTFYRHGWHSWALAHWAVMGDEPVVIQDPIRRRLADDPLLADHSGHVGNYVGAISGPDGTALLLGALGMDTVVEADGETIRGTSRGEPAEWFVAYGPEEQVFADYASALADQVGSVRADPGRVWCSWYSFYQAIAESSMHEALAGVEGLGFDVFQLDDGWQVEIGTWETGPNFPAGMGAMAEAISAAGYRPGLWIAPFIVHERSANSNPEMLVRDEDGSPLIAGYNWGGPYYAIDVTSAAGRAHVSETIRRAVNWGFTYLKLDFIFAAAIPGVREGDLTGDAAYRSGIELIREVAGDDIYLLGCGSPILPSIGIFNGIRVGPDVAPYWENDLNPQFKQDYTSPALRYAISTSVNRLWLKPLVAVDPDVAYFRTRFAILSDAHRQLMADVCHVCDYLAVSDPPWWLSEIEKSQLKAWLAASPTVERVDRYRFRLDGRLVDFEPATLDGPIRTQPGQGAELALPIPHVDR
jgi:alpha-galactosidase